MTTSSSAAATTHHEALSHLRGSDPEEPVVALLSAGDPAGKWSRRSLVAGVAGRMDVWSAAGISDFFEALGPRRRAPRDRGSLGVAAILDYEFGALLEPASGPSRAPGSGGPYASVLELGGTPAVAGGAAPVGTGYSTSALRSDGGRGAFVSAVRSALGLIAAGDIYQVNLTHRLRASVGGNVRELAADAIERTGAWFGACVDLPERTVISASPELLVRVTPAGRIIARPIKGTRPAGGEAALVRSAKDAAELAMIVDLMRNDLGRVCRLGSVRVVEPRAIEPHAGVVHTVGEIVGELRSDVEWEDVIRAVFPAGSVTGAPKIRAQQVIGELESSARGAYCGSILWLAEDGTMDLSVSIRTAEIRAGALAYGVGAGIVADSEPEAEWRETLDKAAGFARAIGAVVEADS